jgi:hypothetical protein
MLTGMAIGLNSTISISEGNKKLPPCPILFLSTSGGLLQVYYFIHKTLPPMCTIPEVLKQIQPVPFNPTQAFIPTCKSSKKERERKDSLYLYDYPIFVIFRRMSRK